LSGAASLRIVTPLYFQSKREVFWPANFVIFTLASGIELRGWVRTVPTGLSGWGGGRAANESTKT
jgi:hypothetical protein